jgi:hypothetical protein
MSKVRNLIFGHGISARHSRGAVKNQVFTLLRIWRNYHHHDFGIERFIRLSLALLQFLTPGLYIKQLLHGRSNTTKKLAIEIYVIFKMIFPILVMKSGNAGNIYTVWIVSFFLFETIIYITSLIFIADAARESVQPRRSLVLLLVNFFEIVLDFALFYAFCEQHYEHFFTRPLHGTTDAIYFSFVTAATVGFGDIAPLHVSGGKTYHHSAYTHLCFRWTFSQLFRKFIAESFSGKCCGSFGKIETYTEEKKLTPSSFVVRPQVSVVNLMKIGHYC